MFGARPHETVDHARRFDVRAGRRAQEHRAPLGSGQPESERHKQSSHARFPVDHPELVGVHGLESHQRFEVGDLDRAEHVENRGRPDETEEFFTEMQRTNLIRRDCFRSVLRHRIHTRLSNDIRGEIVLRGHWLLNYVQIESYLRGSIENATRFRVSRNQILDVRHLDILDIARREFLVFGRVFRHHLVVMVQLHVQLDRKSGLCAKH